MMAVREKPKHVAFLINVNNKELGCVRLSVVQYLYMLKTFHKIGNAHFWNCVYHAFL
jgi:hypothetical protein